MRVEAAEPEIESRRDPRARVTERAILDATVALFREVGPALVTVEAVAERSGVARSTIYRRWPEVDRLFLRACTELTRPARWRRTGELEQDLRTLARAYADDLNDPVFHDVVVFLMEAALRSRPHRARYRAITRARQRRVATVVALAVDAGELPPGTDGVAVADAVMAPLFQRRIAKQEWLTPAHADAAVDAALAALAAQRPGRWRPASRRSG